MEEDEEEAADGGDEAEREGQENAARGCAEEDVVTEEEHLVGVVVVGLRSFYRETTHVGNRPNSAGNREDFELVLRKRVLRIFAFVAEIGMK